MILLLLWSFFIGLGLQAEANSLTPAFRLHLLTEPSSLKPWEQKNSGGIYLLSQVYGTLLKYQDHELKGSLAEKCDYKKPRIILCHLKSGITFSDGTPITAKHFVSSFQDFLRPENHAFRADLLFPVKNAEAYFLGKKKFAEVGILAKSDQNLEISLAQDDPEFLYNLSSPLLTVLKDSRVPLPQNAENLITSGAYKILSWISQKKIVLSHRLNPEIQVEFLFVSEDSVALNLYEKNELQFLRRLPTLYIPKYQNRPDFHEIDQVRFDYIGFGPELEPYPALRQALSLSLPFAELTKLLFAKDSFGCSGLLASSHKNRPCIKPNLTLARKTAQAFDKKLPLLKLYFSKQGGDDFKRSMEWIQNEWVKNIHTHVQLEQMENRIFVDLLKTKAPAIYRKGVAPDRPTCLSAFQTMNENIGGISYAEKYPEFKTLLQNLSKATSNPEAYRVACDKSLNYLLDHALLIPTGPIYFSVLAKPEWIGWNLNELNQLDLSGLSFVKK